MLRELYLDNNKLNTLSENIFQNNKLLGILKISYNNFSYLPKKVFQGLNLIRLTLKGNKNNNLQLEKQILADKISITVLKIKNNIGLTELPQDIFENSLFIRTLSLNNNQLSFLPQNIFHTNIRLEYLNLSFNKLKELPFGIFNFNSQLKELDLSMNQLTSITL